jgi:protoheme IX farnesyltransferase
MIVEQSTAPFSLRIMSTVKAYVAFMKLRLTSLVVVSSVIGYGIGVVTFSWTEAFWLAISGLLVTGASNGFNQLIEKDFDALMKRTMNRPLPTGKMTVMEGLVFATIMAILGLTILYSMFNTLAAVLGALALFSYVFVYTPMKRMSNLAVFAGAFPGAIPPMLGYVAATGQFDLFAGLLFAVQFVWQFPHFWAIAWVSHDDYAKGGYSLLPSRGEKDGHSAFLILLYTLFLLPVAMLPWAFGLTGPWSAGLTALLGLLFVWPSVQLLLKKNDAKAKQVMFASFLYLPLILIVYLMDKV